MIFCCSVKLTFTYVQLAMKLTFTNGAHMFTFLLAQIQATSKVAAQIAKKNWAPGDTGLMYLLSRTAVCV